MKSRLIFDAIFYQSNVLRCTEFAWSLQFWSVSPIADIESEMSEIFQEKLIRGNLIRGKEDIKIQDSAKAI